MVNLHGPLQISDAIYAFLGGYVKKKNRLFFLNEKSNTYMINCYVILIANKLIYNYSLCTYTNLINYQTRVFELIFYKRHKNKSIQNTLKLDGDKL